MDTQVLEELGLTPSEVKVYLALLELGKASAGVVATRSRTTSSKIYEVLDKLMEKGLVSVIVESGVKKFTAADPSLLFSIVEEREEALNKQKIALRKTLPKLRERAELAKHQSESKIYTGMKGLQTAFREGSRKMKKGDIILAMNVPSRSDMVNLFFSRYAKEIEEKQILVRGIYSPDAKGEMQTQIKSEYYQIRYHKNLTPAAINVLGNRVIIFPKETLTPTLFVIDNADVAESFRQQFKVLWELAEE